MGGWHSAVMLLWMVGASVFWGSLVVAGIYLVTRGSGHDTHERAQAGVHANDLTLQIPGRGLAAREDSEEDSEPGTQERPR